jgi:hypothetical protein
MSATKDAVTRNRAEFMRDNRRDDPDGPEAPDSVRFNCRKCDLLIAAAVHPIGNSRPDSFGASVVCPLCDYENGVTVTVHPVDHVRRLTVEVH